MSTGDMEDSAVQMVQVFDLREELRSNPERVKLTQALTLNTDKPQAGLRGVHGLFGSSEWWGSIESGIMPLKRISGTIERAYCAGQGDSGPNNMIDVLTDEGDQESVGIYVNDPNSVGLFREGHQVEILYALDELKRKTAPDGATDYAKVALRMDVSARPV